MTAAATATAAQQPAAAAASNSDRMRPTAAGRMSPLTHRWLVFSGFLALAAVEGRSFIAEHEYFMIVSGGAANAPQTYSFDYKTGGVTTFAASSPSVPDGAGWVATTPARGHRLPLRFYTTASASGGGGTNSVSAFTLSIDSGILVPVCCNQSSGGSGPAHISVHDSGFALLTSNYGSGHIAVLPISLNGELQPPTQVLLAGKNAHQIITDAGSFVFVPCLGVDYIAQYVAVVDPSTRNVTLMPNPGGANAPLRANSGPRHLVFHPTKRFAFVLCELASLMVSMQYDALTGLLSSPEYIDMLPGGVDPGPQGAGAVVISPDGAFLYGSNRGPYCSVVVYSINAQTGLLTNVGFFAENDPSIYWPRFMMMSSDVRSGSSWVVVAGERANALAVFRRDVVTGSLAKTFNWSTTDGALVPPGAGLRGPSWAGVYTGFASAAAGPMRPSASLGVVLACISALVCVSHWQ